MKKVVKDLGKSGNYGQKLGCFRHSQGLGGEKGTKVQDGLTCRKERQ